MRRISAGLLMYRVQGSEVQVLLAHPGGPYFKNKDAGVWSIPKGKVEPGEDLLDTARREFQEETGMRPAGPFLPLTPARQKGGKLVHAWAFQGDCDPSSIVSNQFTIEWPPGSGRVRAFPEIDRVGFFNLDDAGLKINPGQVAFLDQLQECLKKSG